MAKVEITRDKRRKADIIISDGGILTAKKNLVVLIDHEHEDACRATKLFKMKLKRGDHEFVDQDGGNSEG